MKRHLVLVGGRVTPEYRTWGHIKSRCLNPNVPDFKRYGGRGIRICDRWRDDFAAFLADMGHRPSGAHSIDRINNDGDYEPGNCRWATKKEQANNRRRPVVLLCRRGHELTESNAYSSPKGKRRCRTCSRAYQLAYREARKAERSDEMRMGAA